MPIACSDAPLFRRQRRDAQPNYSYDLVEPNKRAAGNIVAILRGANVGDIPCNQASVEEVVPRPGHRDPTLNP
jgi:hypothetical protein